MKNFPINHEGKEYWISRSVAVLGIVFVIGIEKVYILANKRGLGVPDYKYKWNMPCGYVDFNESVEEAVSREIFEETGLNVKEDMLRLLKVNSNPTEDKRQNITFRYLATFVSTNIEEFKNKFTTEYSEKDEVEKVELIDITKINNYKWAFNHFELIHKYSKKLDKKFKKVQNNLKLNNINKNSRYSIFLDL
jgi:ADP-ribose pyrophosphatase YjhB (NUDIX family)